MIGRFPKEAVTRVFEGLGPEKVARALHDPRLKDGQWDRCFLALAYGKPDRLLMRMTLRHLRHPLQILMRFFRGEGPPDLVPDATSILRLRGQDVNAFVCMFDDDEERPTVLRLAAEWLEEVQRAAPVAEMARV